MYDIVKMDTGREQSEREAEESAHSVTGAKRTVASANSHRKNCMGFYFASVLAQDVAYLFVNLPIQRYNDPHPSFEEGLVSICQSGGEKVHSTKGPRLFAMFFSRRTFDFDFSNP